MSHRYWRLYIDDSNYGGYVNLMELELRTSIGGSSVATGGTASASSTGFGWSASNAFDGLTNTFGTGWHSNTNNLPTTAEWLQYDFGAGNDKDIAEFAIWARTSQVDFFPKDFRLQWSDNGSTYTDVWRAKGVTSWNVTNPKAFHADFRYDVSGENKRFWRVRPTAVDGGASCSITELKMYAGTPTNECSGGDIFSSSCQEGSDTLAFNGVITSGDYWAGLNATSWIGYRLPSAKTITTVGITGRGSGFQTQSPKDFVVEYWDGSAFQTAFSITGASGWTALQTRYFDATGEVSGPPAAATARPVVFICC
jgi:hypothetical protein